MKCPICHRPTTYDKSNPHRPFCSERCKLLDFGAWANEEYAVPAEEAPPAPPDSPQGTTHLDDAE
jgi:hypothetical protein